MSQLPDYITISHNTLSKFKKRWKLDDIKNMSLHEYNSLDNKDSFCYWVEHHADNLGRIKGNYSSMFGIWHMKQVKDSKSFIHDGTYKWGRKYGNSAAEVFENIKNNIIQIVEAAIAKEFYKIDAIQYNSLPKWKIAFIYSDYDLVPIYKRDTLRQVAENLEHPNILGTPIHELHTYILGQKPKEQDVFDFTWKQFALAEKKLERNYYIIGSKYGDANGNINVDVAPYFYKHSVIGTGYFWGTDLKDLYGKDRHHIQKWMDKHLQKKYSDRYTTAKRVLSFFLEIQPGDIIAVKSHGQYGDLTIIAYAEVISINGEVYFHSTENELGHCIHVNFLETNLYNETKLSYGQTIHKIIPHQREGHFEKIFSGYSVLNIDQNIINSEDINDDFELSESRIQEKQTESKERTVTYTATVRKTHNKIQSAFAKHLQQMYPYDIIHTEYKYIDVVRQNDNELFYYEIKPFSSAYSCIRAAMGQLLDYYHSNPHSQKKIYLVVVGPAIISKDDTKFIYFIKQSLNLPFEYISFKNY